MQVSIIIPTYNRLEDLDKCLNSLITQTILPKEIIIVDDSDNDEIENLIKQREKEFKKEDVLLRYIRNEKEKSIAIARNIGVENTAGDIILFLDSDVILNEDYIKEILKVYEGQQNALGVQGYITNLRSGYRVPKTINIWNFLFLGIFWSSVEKNRCRVLSSRLTYPYFIDKIISCEWMIGANSSYLREAFEEMDGFDENLKKYSYGEDVDLSYRIFKKYPDSLYMTPHAKLIHNVSQIGRLPQRELINLKEIYSLYLFYKNRNQTFKNKLLFLWDRISHLISAVLYQRQKRILQFKYTIGAYTMCIKHVREIKEGKLDFFNKRLE